MSRTKDPITDETSGTSGPMGAVVLPIGDDRKDVDLYYDLDTDGIVTILVGWDVSTDGTFNPADWDVFATINTTESTTPSSDVVQINTVYRYVAMYAQNAIPDADVNALKAYSKGD